MQHSVIATYELVGRKIGGESIPVRVVLCKPIQSQRMAPAWSCEVSVEPLWSKPFEIFGEGSFHALCLGAKHAVQMLATFIEQEGTLEYTDGENFEPSIFGFKLLPNEGGTGAA